MQGKGSEINKVNKDFMEIFRVRGIIAFLVVLISLLSMQVSCKQQETDAFAIPEYVILECSIPECVSEQAVVGKLLEESEVFRKFYKAERHKMPVHIHWIEDSSLPVTVPGVTVLSKDQVRLRQIPPGIEDAHVVAHELAVFILQNEGFPSTKPSKMGYELKAEYVADLLNDVFWTPLRDLRLREYGFDVEESYEFLLGEFFDGPFFFSKNQEGRQMFEYARLELYWEDVLGKTNTSRFQRQFKEWYPNIAEDVDILISKIRTIGYDTPPKLEALYTYLIKEYKIELVELRY